MKICLLGAQGTGKTTLVNEFRKENLIIDNIARRVIRKQKESGIDDDLQKQQDIFNDYLSALNNNDYISTRSVIDVLAYTLYQIKYKYYNSDKLKEWDDEYKHQDELTEKWLKDNSDVVICYIPIEFEIEDDGLRPIDPKYQEQMDSLMYMLFCQLDIKYKYIIKGPLEKRIKQLEHIIKIHAKD